MIVYSNYKPMVHQYQALRAAIGWSLEGISQERIQESLNASPYCITAWEDKEFGKLVGMVRISGDRGMYGYIQDTMVLPEYQHQGIGKEMMRRLLDNIRDNKGYLLGVCPSKVSVEFYRSFGFINRPEKPNGFMYTEIKDE